MLLNKALDFIPKLLESRNLRLPSGPQVDALLSPILGIIQQVFSAFSAQAGGIDADTVKTVQAYAASHAQDIADPAQRQLIAWRMLGQAVTREANVLAYNDVFLLIGWLAIATLAWLLADLVLQRRRARRDGVLPTTPIPARP